jgi:hypothetical protein
MPVSGVCPLPGGRREATAAIDMVNFLAILSAKIGITVQY